MPSLRVGLLGVFSLLTLSVYAATTKRPTPPPSADSKADVRQAIEDADGRFTPEVRAVYLNWAEQSVCDELTAKKIAIPVDCLVEVDADPTVRDALFGAIYPPDPSILQNYARFRDALGPAFMQKYRSLVLGFSVNRRIHGIISVKNPAPDINLDDDIAIPSEDAISDPAAAAEVPPSQNHQVVSAIAGYMKKTGLSALQLYNTPANKTDLFANLKTQGFPAGVLEQDQHPDRYVALLKSAMVELDQRPAHREAQPDQVAWMRYLASVYEAKPQSVPKGMSWPLFPLAAAPWPLLMPLTHTVPLGEARYIWEKFQGEYGPDRFHSYGPYREPPDVTPHELQPLAWNWAAWPSRILAGGECVVMSGITVDLYSALDRPALFAAQPGHSNLVSFHQTKGRWYAVIEQAFAGGTPQTKALWPFGDWESAPQRDKYWAGAEYHLGLAQAMNTGLRSYIDTRIAVNLYRILPEAEQKTLGVKLLTQAIAINPFNAEPWYLLARQTTTAMQGLALTQAAHQHNPGAMNVDPEAASQPSLQNWTEVDAAKPVDDAVSQYWYTLEKFLVHLSILSHPVPADDASARQIYDFLKDNHTRLLPASLAPYTQRFAAADPNAASPAPTK